MSDPLKPLEVPSPPRPKRLNRLALVAVVALLGVAVAAVFLTLAPPPRARGAESPEGPGPPRPGFLEHEPAGTAPAPRAAPAEASRYWQDAMREGGTPREGGGSAGAPVAAGAAGMAGAAEQGLPEAWSEPGSTAPPGVAAAERARTPAPSARDAAYRRALLAPVTPARAAMEAGEGAAEGAAERMARQPGSPWLSALPGLPGMPSLTALPGLPAPAATGGPPMMPATLSPAGIATGQLPEGAGAAGAGGVTVAAPGVGGAPAAPGGDRRDHQAFLRSAETLAPAELRVRRDRPGAGVRVEAGTVLPAALVTAVDSDVAGPLVAQVTQDVFDRDQRQVVIPRGSRLIGSYDSQVALGESRLLVAWSRVVFPDGSGLSFPGLPAATRAGEAGLPGSVDNHLARVFGSAVLLSLLGAGAQLSQPQESAAFGTAASTRQVAAAAVGQELSSVAIELLRRQLSVPPTIRIAAGTRFYVFLRGDVRFEEPGQE